MRRNLHKASACSAPVFRPHRYGATVAIAAALSLWLCSVPVRADVRIGIIGDQTGAVDLDTSYAVLQQGVNALGAQAPNVVLHAGDLIESTQSQAQIQQRFAQAVGILKGLGTVPWYMTAGDHDVNPPSFQQNSPDRSRETLFKQLYGAVNPLAQQQLYYSFDVNGYHFVVLNSMEILDADPRWGNAFYSGLSDAQFDWLSGDLATNGTGAKGIVVLLHHPMWYMWANWDRVHQLLKRYPTRHVIAGHFHYNQVDSQLDGITYTVVGATGGDTKHGTSNAGDLQHVTMLTLHDDATYDFRMIPLPPFTQIAWTPRQVMDRMQAQDSLLGNLFNFAGNSPVFVQNGLLWATCGSGTPARLVLGNLGNADASPVDVSIAVSPPGINIAGQFGQGMCSANAGPMSCRLNASAGVAVANTSIVETSTYPSPPTLWTGIIGGANPLPLVNSNITVTVTMTLTANNQQYSVSHSASTPVQACP